MPATCWFYNAQAVGTQAMFENTARVTALGAASRE